MALRLIDDMSEKWQPEKIRQGQTEEITQPGKAENEPAGAEVVDLMALLRGSVEKSQAKPRRKAARKAG